MIDTAALYIDKAYESLAGAESELANRRYNNCANRCYYACFQAAIAALLQTGLQARSGQWGHDFVQAEFVGLLINRRKHYPAALRDTLVRNYLLRATADYDSKPISELEATRALRRSREFVAAVQERAGEAR